MAKPKKTRQFVDTLKKLGLWRIGLLSGAGMIGAVTAFAIAISGVTRTKNPQLALMFVPGESNALAGRADQLFFINPQRPPKSVKALAEAALDEQALNPRALRLLGYYAEIQGKRAQAEQYVRMAAKLSRRETGAQMWLIEANARKNDTRQTLIHYDIALRTKPDSSAILFPRLLSAIEDRDIRTALKPYIRANNIWANQFLIFANVNSKNLPALTDLIVETGGLPAGKASQNQELVLLQRLVHDQFFSDARRLFLSMEGAKAARLTSAAFDADDRVDRFGPMVWQLVNDPDAGAGLLAANGGSAPMLSVYANSATTRVVATKLLYLSAGEYTFSAKLASLNRGDGGYLVWQMRCVSDASRDPFWKLTGSGMSQKSALAITAGCKVQQLEVVASGGNGRDGLEAAITDIGFIRQPL
jgi:tetratricopeptide (TPR) repeat protein